MAFFKLASLAALLSTFGLVSGDCLLHNQLGFNEGTVETRETLCTPQADGNYQLALEVSEVGVPTFDGDNAFAGVVGSDVFILYASDCTRLGVYSRGNEGNDCGVPYTIDFFGVDPPLSIYNVFFDVGAPRFSFDFLGESYSTSDSKCGGCGDMSDGLRADVGCKCGFFVADFDLEVPTDNGRSVSFRA